MSGCRLSYLSIAKQKDMIKDTSIDQTKGKLKIPEVRFNLKSHSDSSSPILISAVFRYEGKRLVYTTREHVLPKFWNKSKGRAKESVNYTDGADINETLDRINKLIRNVYRKLFLGKSAMPSEIKKELDYRLGRLERPTVKNKDHLNLYEFIQKEIDKNKAIVLNKRGGQTWQKYLGLYNRLEDFETISEYNNIDYSDINEIFKDEFVMWLRGKGLSENTISKDVETLKTMLKRSRRYHSNNYYTDPDFKVERIKIPKNFPTLDELKELYIFEFSDKETQEGIDLYLISAFGGGLRWSDVKKLSEENEISKKGEKVLQVFTYKGRNTKDDNEVIIPITPQLRALIKKYNWSFPQIHEKDITEIVRKGFKEAGIDRQILLKSGIMGEDPESKKLYEVVSFHTARYAYINYMINDLEVSAEQLQKITGQSLQVLLGYENGDKGKNAIKVAAKINKQLQGLTVVKNEAV